MKKSEKKRGEKGDLKKRGPGYKKGYKKKAEKIFMIRGKSVFLY